MTTEKQNTVTETTEPKADAPKGLPWRMPGATPEAAKEPVAAETATEAAEVAPEPVVAEPKADPKPKHKAPATRKGKGAATDAKPATKPKGTAKPAAKKGAAKRKAKAVVPPGKWKPGGQQTAVFKALRRKNGATGDDCNKAYWPNGDKKAGWRCVLDKVPYQWGKRSGCHGYVKREGRKVRLWLRTPAEVAKFGEPEGAKKIYTYKEPKAA